MSSPTASGTPDNRRKRVATKNPFKELLEWTQNRLSNYEKIHIKNFSVSWRNGLAFCALVHSYFPDAFDYNTLEAENKEYNFTLAFETAESLGGVKPLLDVKDLVEVGTDSQCVFTYVKCLKLQMETQFQTRDHICQPH